MKKPKRMPNVSEQEVLAGVSIRLICESKRLRYDALLDKQHYLKSGQLVGEQLRYVAEYAGKWLALLSWNAGSYHLADRDRWIGWSDEQRRCRLPFVVNNSRFLILDGVGCPNLASRVMKVTLQRLSSDWSDAYGHEVLLAESFVDPQLFRSIAYLASGWSSHFEFKKESLRVRTDFVTRPSRLSSDRLALMWREQAKAHFPFVSISDLVELKKTNREKDYAVIGELSRCLKDASEQMLSSRSVRDLMQLSDTHAALVSQLAAKRPLLNELPRSKLRSI